LGGETVPETTQTQQQAIPIIAYMDVAAAIDWLATAFGFKERGERYTEPDGTVSHAELELNGGIVMLGYPGPEYQSPARHAEVCQSAAKWLELPYIIDGVMVYVVDVDRHCAQARSAGATILREPQDEPYGRLYNAADLEGHRWMFMEDPHA
jgi:uncharacterized glyoxalase superfamily protein PhnB